MNDQWLQEALANVDGLVAIATTHSRLSSSVRPGFERARAGLEAHLRTALAAPPARTDGAPPELWLQLHGDGEPDGKPVDYKADVSWCWEQIHPHDVRYVLAQPAAEPAACDLLTAARRVLDTHEEEAAANLSLDNAESNFSQAGPERRRAAIAMVAASTAEKRLREIVKAAEATALASPPSPRLPVRLSEAEIDIAIDTANWAFNVYRSTGELGQQITARDDWKHWLAKEIQAAVLAANGISGE